MTITINILHPSNRRDMYVNDISPLKRPHYVIFVNLKELFLHFFSVIASVNVTSGKQKIYTTYLLLNILSFFELNGELKWTYYRNKK